MSDSIRPLFKLRREQIDRSIRLDAKMPRTLERDQLSSGRLERLRTIAGVGPITALTWVLEIGAYCAYAPSSRRSSTVP